MNRNTSKPARKEKSDGVKNDDILPELSEIGSRYIQWKTLFDKFDKPSPDDDEGLLLDDALDAFCKGGDDAEDVKEPSAQQEALECSDDDDEQENNEKYDALQKEITTAMKERSEQWKRNGLDQIFKDDFSQSVDVVQKWLEKCEIGTGRQVTKERETRFTEYNGNTQLDVTHRENVSVTNESARKQMTTEHSSNYAFRDTDQRRVVVHQVEKTTISSYLVEPHASNGDSTNAVLTLPMDSFFGNMSRYTPFKIPDAIEQLRSAGRDRHAVVQYRPRQINPGPSGNATMSKWLDSSLKLVPKSRVLDDLQKKPRSSPAVPSRRVNFKPAKKVQISRPKVIQSPSSSEHPSSSDSDSRADSVSSSDSDCFSDWAEEGHRSAKKGIKTVKNATKVLHPRKDSAKVKNRPIFPSSSSSSNDEQCNTVSNSSTDSIKKKYRTRTMAKKLSAPASAASGSETENKPPEHQYSLPISYRQMLSIRGRCRYKIDGTIVYRPKPHDHGLPSDTEKIEIKTEDLDLSEIKCRERREKFENFNRLTHPNTVLVYYMTDSESEALLKNDDTSDDDDPINNYKPNLCVLAFFNGETQSS